MTSIDVIIPCYRYGHFLRECVDSVVSQQVPSLRILIIDDASPDDSAEVAGDLARQDPRIHLIQHAKNKGHISTYNEGIEWATSEFMLILSADDYLLPGSLGRSLDLLTKCPDAGLAFGHAMAIYSDEQPDRTNGPISSDKPYSYRILSLRSFIEASRGGNIVPTATAVVRTELQKLVGGYRPELPHSGDMEMWMRFAAHANVGYIDAFQAVYRRHRGNMSTAYMRDCWLPDLKQRECAIDWFFRECGHLAPNREELRAILMRSLGRCALSHASEAFNNGDLELSLNIREFAIRVCPQLTRSWPWTKLLVKRALGPKGWSTLSPAVARVKDLL
jgi:hypothetical protein